MGFEAAMLVSVILLSCAGTGQNVTGDAQMSNEPSKNPPGGLTPKDVPMFVSIGFDDNAFSGLQGSGGDGGMTWATDMLLKRTNPDGTKARVTFFYSTVNMENPDAEDPALVRQSWQTAIADGHEAGNHTHSHPHGATLSQTEWEAEMLACSTGIQKLDEADTASSGFRAPFLEYNDAALSAVANLGFAYDCSIEEGFEPDQDGTDFFWPYRLDQGSPGNEILVEFELKKPITPHPGLYELPVYVVIVPPDDQCEAYGVPRGMRSRMKTVHDWFDETSGKITGFDYNLWVMFAMTKAEFLATLKYSFDLRMKGNRAPFLFGGHSDIYATKYETLPNSTVKERQEAIEEFLDYALTHDAVRVRPYADIQEWVENPRPI